MNFNSLMSSGSRKVPNKTLRKTQNSHCANFFHLFFKKNRSKKMGDGSLGFSLGIRQTPFAGSQKFRQG
jgi:hypothetical protein